MNNRIIICRNILASVVSIFFIIVCSGCFSPKSVNSISDEKPELQSSEKVLSRVQDNLITEVSTVENVLKDARGNKTPIFEQIEKSIRANRSMNLKLAVQKFLKFAFLAEDGDTETLNLKKIEGRLDQIENLLGVQTPLSVRKLFLTKEVDVSVADVSQAISDIEKKWIDGFIAFSGLYILANAEMRKGLYSFDDTWVRSKNCYLGSDIDRKIKVKTEFDIVSQVSLAKVKQIKKAVLTTLETFTAAPYICSKESRLNHGLRLVVGNKTDLSWAKKNKYPQHPIFIDESESIQLIRKKISKLFDYTFLVKKGPTPLPEVVVDSKPFYNLNTIPMMSVAVEISDMSYVEVLSRVKILVAQDLIARMIGFRTNIKGKFSYKDPSLSYGVEEPFEYYYLEDRDGSQNSNYLSRWYVSEISEVRHWCSVGKLIPNFPLFWDCLLGWRTQQEFKTSLPLNFQIDKLQKVMINERPYSVENGIDLPQLQISTLSDLGLDFTQALQAMLQVSAVLLDKLSPAEVLQLANLNVPLVVNTEELSNLTSDASSRKLNAALVDFAYSNYTQSKLSFDPSKNTSIRYSIVDYNLIRDVLKVLNDDEPAEAYGDEIDRNWYIYPEYYIASRSYFQIKKAFTIDEQLFLTNRAEIVLKDIESRLSQKFKANWNYWIYLNMRNYDKDYWSILDGVDLKSPTKEQLEQVDRLLQSMIMFFPSRTGSTYFAVSKEYNEDPISAFEIVSHELGNQLENSFFEKKNEFIFVNSKDSNVYPLKVGRRLVFSYEISDSIYRQKSIVLSRRNPVILTGNQEHIKEEVLSRLTVEVNKNSVEGTIFRFLDESKHDENVKKIPLKDIKALVMSKLDKNKYYSFSSETVDETGVKKKLVSIVLSDNAPKCIDTKYKIPLEVEGPLVINPRIGLKALSRCLDSHLIHRYLGVKIRVYGSEDIGPIVNKIVGYGEKLTKEGFTPIKNQPTSPRNGGVNYRGLTLVVTSSLAPGTLASDSPQNYRAANSASLNDQTLFWLWSGRLGLNLPNSIGYSFSNDENLCDADRPGYECTFSKGGQVSKEEFEQEVQRRLLFLEKYHLLSPRVGRFSPTSNMGIDSVKSLTKTEEDLIKLFYHKSLLRKIGNLNSAVAEHFRYVSAAGTDYSGSEDFITDIHDFLNCRREAEDAIEMLMGGDFGLIFSDAFSPKVQVSETSSKFTSIVCPVTASEEEIKNSVLISASRNLVVPSQHLEGFYYRNTNMQIDEFKTKVVNPMEAALEDYFEGQKFKLKSGSFIVEKYGPKFVMRRNMSYHPYTHYWTTKKGLEVYRFFEDALEPRIQFLSESLKSNPGDLQKALLPYIEF